MAILADTAGPKDAGLAMGFVTMCIALGVVLGPMLGGILYHHFGYEAVFVSAYSLVVLDLLLRIFMLLDKDKSPQEAALKPNVQTYGTFPSNDGNTEQPATPKHGQKMRQPSLNSSVTASSGESMPLRSQRWTQRTAHQNPLLILLSTPRMLAAILSDFMQSLVLTGLESILPLRIKTLFQYNSMEVALVFLLLAFPAFAAPAIGYLSDRVGAKVVICLGFLFVAPLLVLLRLVDHYEISQVVILCILLFLTGVSLNMILTPAWSEAVYVVDGKEASTPGIFGAKGAYAQAFGLMNVAYAGGSLAGPLLGGLLVERVGWNNLTLATGIVCALCTLPCLYATGGRRPREPAMVVEGGEYDGDMGLGDS
ncbi:hypothetical protein MMC28_001692 [Mycoblastus sanguinarius]|nr:hypothetical protein [Mycoblastus sanguinarius]